MILKFVFFNYHLKLKKNKLRDFSIEKLLFNIGKLETFYLEKGSPAIMFFFCFV